MRTYLLGAAALLIAALPAEAATQKAVAKFVDVNGQAAGIATFTSTRHGVLVDVKVTGLNEGPHGIHIHTSGNCDVKTRFTAAGPHLSFDPKPHRSVAFPLAHIPLTLTWSRPKPYAENPQTLAEHLRKHRKEAGKKQGEMAQEIGVDQTTYTRWEGGKYDPAPEHFPSIVRVLGYDPLPSPKTLGEHLVRQRLKLGLTQREAAVAIGVERDYLSRWERDQQHPGRHMGAVERFLGQGVLPLGTPD